MRSGFSLSSMILGYFLVGGGLFTGTLAGTALKVDTQVLAYGLLAAGAAVGGFIAGRTSRGQTILEPAIGAVAVVATIVALAANTPLGQLIWSVAKDETMKFVGAVGATSMAGAIAGAFVSEKMFGEASRSSVPWVLYTALSTFGACLLATMIATLIFARSDGGKQAVDTMGITMIIGMGAGCLLAGLAVGASSWSRPLLASFLGAGAGVAGFFALVLRAAPRTGETSDAVVGVAVLAVGGGVASLIGSAIGWGTVGKNQTA